MNDVFKKNKKIYRQFKNPRELEAENYHNLQFKLPYQRELGNIYLLKN